MVCVSQWWIKFRVERYSSSVTKVEQKITPQVFLVAALILSVPRVATPKQAQDVFTQYMQADIEPADGFDFPVGNPDAKGSYRDAKTGLQYRGWYVATEFMESFSLGIHPGEDWNGRGGGNTDLSQAVFSVANGKVVFADDCGNPWGKVVMIEHLYYENHEKKTIRSLYAHLEGFQVKKGEKVSRRQKIGTIGLDPEKQYLAHLHLELRRDASLPPTYWPSSHDKKDAWIASHYASPSGFIRSHRRLFVPQRESTLLLVHQASYTMQLFENGKLVGEYQVSFGQSKGRKRRRGDNRTPKGMYFVVYHHRGKFGGDFGAYYGIKKKCEKKG